MSVFLRSLVLCMLPLSCLAADVQKMFATRIETAEGGEISGYLCVLGTNKYSFIAPPGWKPEAKLDRGEVIFMTPELNASLTLKMTDGGKFTRGSDLSEQLQQRFPNANVVDTFNCYAVNEIGQGYILEQKTADKGKIKIRYGVVPIPGGTAEFILRAPATRMPDLHLPYGRFLASFRVEGHKPRR
jgi:hypothetical protein